MARDLPLWKRPRAQLLALTALIWALGAVLLALAWTALLPFVLAALAAYVIDPLIARLARLRPAGRPSFFCGRGALLLASPTPHSHPTQRRSPA